MKFGGPPKMTRSTLEGPKKRKKAEAGSRIEQKTVGTRKNGLVPFVPKVSNIVDPKKVKKAKRALAEKQGDILELLEAGDQDGGLSILKKTLLVSVLNALPHAEKVIQESETTKGVYPYVTLISQIRELITDIQADRDKQYIAQQLLETIIRPAFMDIAQNLIIKNHEFRKVTSDYVNVKHTQAFSAALQRLAKELAADMMVQYRSISEKMIEALKI